MADDTRVQSFIKRRKIPVWATEDETRDNAYIVDVNLAYPFWQGVLRGKKDKYWAEVYRRCTVQLLKDIFKEPIIVALRDVEGLGTWKLKNLPGTKEDEAQGAAAFHSYYRLAT